MTEDGKRLEAEVEAICSKAYLSDFVIKSPQYRKSDGQFKEAADALLVTRDTAVVMQLKTRIQPSAVSMSEVDAARLQKTIDEAIDQTKTCWSAIRHRTLTDLKSVRGTVFPFHYESVKNIIGVVLVHSYSEEPLNYKTARIHLPRVHSEYGYPVHVMRYSDFIAVADELSTLSDLLAYLSLREVIFTKGLIPSLTPELDLLGIYVTQYPNLEAGVASEVPMILEAGIWDKFRSMNDIIEARARKRGVSLIYDHVIEKIHESLDFSLNALHGIDTERRDQSTPEQYAEMGRELSWLNRLGRIYFATKMVEKMKIADQLPRSYFSYGIEDNNSAILFFASSADRLRRREEMAAATQMQVAGRNLDYAVGIATEQWTSESRSFDFALVGELPLDLKTDLKRLWDQLEVRTSRPSGDEWDVARE